MTSKDKKPGIDAAAVRELAKLLKETGLTEIEIEHDGARIRVSRGAKSCLNMGGPPSKPKYSCVTDSELVP